MERIWAVLETASKCMKEMGYANRAAFFNDVMYDYGESLNLKAGKRKAVLSKKKLFGTFMFKASGLKNDTKMPNGLRIRQTMT